MRKFLFFLIGCFLLSHWSCLQEEGVQRKYPRIFTDPISDITPNGARFSATIEFENLDEIAEVGFIWGENSNLVATSASYILSLGKTTSNIIAEDIRSSLVDKRNYYVRSFAVKSGKTVYGNIVSFKSLGSEGPKITGLLPQVVVFSDTIQVLGRNFTSNAILKFGGENITSSIVKTEKDKIKFLLPASLPAHLVEGFVTVSIEGNVSQSPMPLKLDVERILPKIFSITPLAVKACDTITIRGKNFIHSNNVGAVSVWDNSGNLIVLSATNDKIVCVLKRIPKDDINLTMYNGKYVTSISEANINLIEVRPEILSVSPLIYKSKDIITIKVKNFPYCDNSAYSVFFVGNNIYNPQILSTSRDEIKLQLPEGCFGHFTIFLAFPSPNYLEYQQLETPVFTPHPPEVTSIEPSHGSLNDEIVIKGNYLAGHLVDILEITSSTDTEIRGKLIESSRVKGDRFVDVEFTGCDFLSIENGFKYDPIEILDFNPKIINSPSQSITIIGKNFSSAPTSNVVTIGSFISENFVSVDNKTIIVPASALIPDGSVAQNESLSINVINGMGMSTTSPIPLVIDHEISWYRLNDFTGQGIQSGVSFSIGSKGYAGIGTQSSEFWQYDPLTDSWHEKALYPGHTSDPRSMVSVAANGKGYVGLDRTFNNEWWEYDPMADSWLRKKDYPGSLAIGGFAFEIGGKVYAGGGSSYTLNLEFWEYNPATDSWTRKADLLNYGGKGEGNANFSFKGKGHIYGTNNGLSYFEYIFDPSANTWTVRQIETLSENYYVLSVNICMVFEDYVILGGQKNERGDSRNKFFKIIPGSGDFKLVDYAGAARIEQIGFAIGNYGYFGLGLDGYNYSKSLEMWKFDPSKFK